MSTVGALKLFNRVGKRGYYGIIIFFDLFMWAFAGMIYYVMTNEIEAWDAMESFSMAWKGMFQPAPFIIGHSIGLLFWWSLRTIRNKPEGTDYLFWGNPTANDLAAIRNLGFDKKYSVVKEISLSNSDIDKVKARSVSWIKSYDLHETTISFFEETDSNLVFNFKDKIPYSSTYQSISRFIEIKFQQIGDDVNVNIRQYPAVKWDQFDVELAEVYWVNFVKEFLSAVGNDGDLFQQDALLSEREKELQEYEFKMHPKRLLKKVVEIPLVFFVTVGSVGALGIYVVRGSWQPVFEWIFLCFGVCLVLGIVLLIIMYFQSYNK